MFCALLSPKMRYNSTLQLEAKTNLTPHAWLGERTEENTAWGSTVYCLHSKYCVTNTDMMFIPVFYPVQSVDPI